MVRKDDCKTSVDLTFTIFIATTVPCSLQLLFPAIPHSGNTCKSEELAYNFENSSRKNQVNIREFRNPDTCMYTYKQVYNNI